MSAVYATLSSEKQLRFFEFLNMMSASYLFLLNIINNLIMSFNMRQILR